MIGAGRRRAALLALFLAISASAASAQVPGLREVPVDAQEPARTELGQLRHVLSTRLSKLKQEVQAFNARCASVVVGSAADAQCKQRWAQLESIRSAYVADANAYNARVRDVPRWHLPKEVTVGEAAARSGMLQKHVERLVQFAKNHHYLMVFRASNKASVKFYEDPRFIAKPEGIDDKTQPEGRQYAGMVVHNGEPLTIDGKWVHADYDMQGVYRLRDDGRFAKVDTDNRDHPGGKNFVDDINAKLFRGHPMIMHGDNDGYAKFTPEVERKMRRLPEPDEKFLIIEPNGKMRIAEGLKSLNGYYDNLRIHWPYANVKLHPQLQDPNPTRDPDVQSGIDAIRKQDHK